MVYHVFAIAILSISMASPALAQLSQDAKFEILRTVMAQQAASRIAMPLGSGGVELTEAGEIDQEKITEQLDEDGLAIEPGKVVTITKIDFGGDSIELELDGGGKKKTSFFDRIQVGVGSKTTPIGGSDSAEPPKGSRITLKFDKKVPVNLTPDQLRLLLDPVLDFNPKNFLKTGIDALPEEFREAVIAKEARIGMDRSTVIMALGRPNNKYRETKNGIFTETWLYNLRGLRTLFVAFEENVVVEIKQY